ncbi:MAG TPA: EAL domain-containing protein, partial [Halothiobacillaceae bacterium]|nr:EAL domain-containing protein [Halothiobacillaceae bacterium]
MVPIKNLTPKEIISDALRSRLQQSGIGQKLADVLEKRSLNILFQPVVDIRAQRIFGYEALARGPADSELHQPLALFQAACDYDCLFEIDWLARSKAIESFFKQSTDQSRLFLNVTINSLMARGHQTGMTLDFLAEMGVPVDRVVIELTEHHP